MIYATDFHESFEALFEQNLVWDDQIVDVAAVLGSAEAVAAVLGSAEAVAAVLGSAEVVAAVLGSAEVVAAVLGSAEVVAAVWVSVEDEVVVDVLHDVAASFHQIRPSSNLTD